MFGIGLRTALWMIAATVAALALAGCGGGGYDESAMDDAGYSNEFLDFQAQAGEAARDGEMVKITQALSPMDAPTAGYGGGSPQVVEVVREVEVLKEVLKEVEVASDAPAAMPTAAPIAASVGGVDVPDQDEIRARYASVQRVIVRTARVGLVVDAVQPSLDAIGRAAEDAGGWVVSTNRASKHSGSISVRVPAPELDGFIETLRGMAAEVVSESTDSQDVTDEYFDLRARLDNMLATQERMLEFLDLAPDARQALEVQRDLNELQTDIERAKGRIQLLEETSAFSLVTVNLTLAAQDMAVDAGPDRTEAAGEPIRFRATFTPPPDISQFSATWDFGDGSPPVTVHRAAPTATDRGERVTETVTHFYEDPTDSPFIVSVSVSGTGEGGVAEGEDTLIASVSRIPQIQVYAGEGWMEVEQNSETLFSGSFTRPEGLRNVRYEWDFGDGSPPVSGEMEDETRVAASHAYPDYRDLPYTARLTITADSDAGKVSAEADVSVIVRRERGFVVAGFDFSNTLKDAVRALSAAAQILLTVAIWLIIFSPAWGALGALIWFIIRLDARGRAKRRAEMEARLEAERAADEERET